MRDIQLPDDTVIQAEELFDLPDDAGAVMWDAGLVMAYYLIHASCEPEVSEFLYSVKGKHIVEIGSGPGLVGLVAAGLGAAQVILSDLPHLLPNLEGNIKLNKLEANTKCMELTWGEAKQIQHVLGYIHKARSASPDSPCASPDNPCASPDSPNGSPCDSPASPDASPNSPSDRPPSPSKRRTPDIILASDCVYKMTELDDLLATISSLLKGDYNAKELEEGVDLMFDEPVCLLSFEDREGAKGFLEDLPRHGLVSTEANIAIDVCQH
eukprot:gene7294-410_t